MSPEGWEYLSALMVTKQPFFIILKTAVFFPKDFSLFVY